MSKARNRGKLSNDDSYFSSKWLPIFTEAADDMTFLLSRGYGATASLQIVGNRYRLNKRQRLALARISCSRQAIERRKSLEIGEAQLVNQKVEIDGFNLLILLENALSGAYLFAGRDGVYRDISSVHGSYKRVVKTEEAILLIGNTLKQLGVQSIKWYLDQPVSNSGRLKTKLLELSRAGGFNWEVELVFDPDKILAKSNDVVISSDGWILDQAQKWFNLGSFIIQYQIREANVIEV